MTGGSVQAGRALLACLINVAVSGPEKIVRSNVMFNKYSIFAAAICGFSALSITPAQADSEPRDGYRSGFYIGANYGGFKSRGDEFDDDNDYYEAVVGGNISPYFAIEGSYTDFGDFGGKLASADLDGYGIAVIGRLPITDVFSVYAKAGQFFWESDVDVLGARTDVEGDEPFFAAGLDFLLTDHFSVALEYSRYKFDLSDSSLPDALDDYETDIDTVKLGAKLLF
ncbi:MAG: porin family protein [Spongiibacteraceae bacterium]|jgi:opacity protein-like surface antigen|nr:porin family protein [Spongiibacteraceae bacterium]